MNNRKEKVFMLYICEFESHSWRGVLDTTLCDKVCQWLATGWWFSPGNPVSSTNKTDCHNITEILLKVALSTIIGINQTKPYSSPIFSVLWYLIFYWDLNDNLFALLTLKFQ